MSEHAAHAVEGDWTGPVPTEPPGGAVPRLLDELAESIERLHAHVDRLQMRLDPALRSLDERPSSDMLAVARERRSEIAGRIGSHVDRLDGANHRVAELIERLDL